MAFVSSPFLLCLVPISFFQITLAPGELGGNKPKSMIQLALARFMQCDSPEARNKVALVVGPGLLSKGSLVEPWFLQGTCLHFTTCRDLHILTSIWTEYLQCPAATGWLEASRPDGSKSDGVASRLLSKLADLALSPLGCGTDSCFHGCCRSELQGRILYP
ncbi:hypothetical protein J3E69DRAFT_253011 [Trichoderma sp. SZMC 28015]